ncbi:hypothetical protein JCM10450v2_000811 [Rhodotorula kratochvilovae]
MDRCGRPRSAFSSRVAALSLFLLAVVQAAEAPDVPASTPATLAAPTEATSDGSGSVPYRTSPSFLLFAIIALLVGPVLLLAGHRLWRVTTALGTSLLLEFVVWVILANELPRDGFSHSSSGSTGIIVWGIVTAGGVVGLVVGGVWWKVGIVAMGADAGVALGLSIALMGDDALPPLARWVVLGIIATSLTGSFLLFLGVDLLVNQISGWSQGLRYILDGNDAHAAQLASYHPPVSSRIFLGASWAVAILAIAFQSWLYIYRWHEPFIRQVVHLNSRTPTRSLPSPPDESPDFASDYRLPHLPPGLGDHMSFVETGTTGSHDTMQERYRQAMGEPAPLTPESRSKSPLLPSQTLAEISALQHARELSDPNEPPTRPASVVSSTFAAGLRSRPPTCFEEPLRPARTRAATPPMPLVALPPLSPGGATATTSFVSQQVPIFAVAPPTPAAGSLPSTPRRPSIPTSVPVGPESDDGTVLRAVYPGGAAGEAFLAGLTTGGAASLPATARTPSSGGGDVSTLLGGKFDLTPPPLPRSFPLSPSRESALDVPTDVTAPLGSSSSVGRPSMDSEAETFETAGESASTGSHAGGGAWHDFPATPTSARTGTRVLSPVEAGAAASDGDETELRVGHGWR